MYVIIFIYTRYLASAAKYVKESINHLTRARESSIKNKSEGFFVLLFKTVTGVYVVEETRIKI